MSIDDCRKAFEAIYKPLNPNGDWSQFEDGTYRGLVQLQWDGFQSAWKRLSRPLPEQPVRKTRVRIERRRLDLPVELFNEAAKPPYQHLFKSSTFDKLLFSALEAVGLEPKSPVTYETPNRFNSIMVNVPILEECDESPMREAVTRVIKDALIQARGTLTFLAHARRTVDGILYDGKIKVAQEAITTALSVME